MLKFHRCFSLIAVFAVAVPNTSAQELIELPRPAQPSGVALSQKAAKELEDQSIALLGEVAEQVSQIRSSENRIQSQMQVAQLLWAYDPQRARKLVEDAMASMKEYLTGVEVGDENYHMIYDTATQLRQEAMTAVAAHDPELALNFLRATRVLSDPYAGPQAHHQVDREAQLELMLANRIAAKDPARALRMAEESLEKGISYGLLETITNLRTVDSPMAAKLAHKIMAKLTGESLLQSSEAGHVAITLLQLDNASPNQGAPDAAAASLLSEQEKRELFNQIVNVTLASTAPSSLNRQTPERNNAQNLLGMLQSMTNEVEKYAPGRAAMIGKRMHEMGGSPDAQGQFWQKYQSIINDGTVDSALEAIRQAPVEMRDNLYQQVASKAANAGDHTRAKQILTDHISNVHQRQQALRSLELQAMQSAVARGKIEEALANASALRNPRERMAMMTQIINQINSSVDKETALTVLQRAQGLIGHAGRAADLEQMNALFEMARAYAPHQPQRAFEITETLADQFNELSAAAVQLNNFGQQFFVDDELVMRNGNTLATIASGLTFTLGTLARTDFERTKSIADKLQRLEVRLGVYLAMVQHALPQDAAMRSRQRG